MSLERRLQETMERSAEAVRPVGDPVNRATARLRASQRRRMFAVTAGLVAVAVGSVVGITQLRDGDDRGSITPVPNPTSSAFDATPASRAVIGAEFASKDAAVAVTEEGLALTLDGGGSWRRLGNVSPWAGDLAFAGSDHVVVAWDATDWFYIIRHPLAECEEPCSSVRMLRTGSPVPGYQGAWLSFVNESHGWLNVGLTLTETSSVAELYETTDGGATWKLVSKPAVGDIVFTDDRTGYLSGGFAGSEGDRLYRTTDAGRSWRDITPATPSGCHRNEAGLPLPHFFDSENGVFLSSLACEGSFEFNRADLMVTRDGGSTWSARGSVRLPNPQDPGTLSVADDRTFVVTNGRSILESTDGGRTFNTTVPETDVVVFGFTFLDPGFGWTTVVRGDCAPSKSCSDPPRLYVTYDRGRSLRAVDVFF